MHTAVDGRLVITDLGSGRDNGAVVAVDLAKGTREVLLDGLPSTRNSGQRFADLAGPSGAGISSNGIVCAAIGDATADRRGFNALRCSDGRSIDLEELERSRNPAGGEIASNPFDTLWLEGAGWLVSDAAGNTLLSVSLSREVGAFAAFPQLPRETTDREAVPAGLFARTGRVFLALFNGAVVELSASNGTAAIDIVGEFTKPIAVHFDETGLYVLEYANEAGEQGTGRIIHVRPDGARRTVVDALDFPTGMTRLESGEFVLAEEAAGRVRLLREPR